ncbi:phosphatidylcholine/phosphatidylserine synthase [Dysgonomonas sp. 511]|uniref:CDP-alcohol phosphatidyltransferase family protein n=1 Tax=Dysgonomonas sp. 511 TaxID=2302930 RepID=UPI0013D3AA64|nr:CDP-alcohol phosphatidyltransferase family protein [Dysgonomonas sp. 511]NDV78741.1 CDP-diacylglycerol--serine O-phosphatidyltransferase [Dysgonomonas sp. 511]
MKNYIPNTLTSLNLLSGCIASVMAFHGKFLCVVAWVIVAAIFDFCDGFTARLLKAYSPLGKELDSLADMVSFGVAPAIAVFTFLSMNMHVISGNAFVVAYLPYVAFLLTVFSAMRLAKFNVDTRQTSSFMGLNTPANAMFWISLSYGLANMPVVSAMLIYTVLFGIVLFSLLMVSEIPMFAFKIKNLKFAGNEYRYILVIGTIIMLIAAEVVLHSFILGIAGAVLFYIALSLISNRKTA